MDYRTSANISEDRKVVLSALREVPEEITFMLSDAEQDPKILGLPKYQEEETPT